MHPFKREEIVIKYFAKTIILYYFLGCTPWPLGHTLVNSLSTTANCLRSLTFNVDEDSALDLRHLEKADQFSVRRSSSLLSGNMLQLH